VGIDEDLDPLATSPMLKQRRHAGHQTAGVRGPSGGFFEPAFGGLLPKRAPVRSGTVSDVCVALKAIGYGGWPVIEQDTTPLDPTENARQNRTHLGKLLAQNGI
jgi:hypothetical protein